MVRALIGSDIHTEFYKSPGKQLRGIPAVPNADDYDVVILAGDIGMGMGGFEWILRTFPEDKAVFYLPGNHEFYKHNFEELREAFQRAAEQSRGRVKMLDPGAVQLTEVIEGEKDDWSDAKIRKINLIGCTLWSSLRLRGYNDPRATELYFQHSISDFDLIRRKNGTEAWTAQSHIWAHEQDVAFLKFALDNCMPDETNVVITHFVPSQTCIAPQYQNSILNPYFTVDMDDLMLDYNIDAWIFGHTHTGMEKVHPAGTKMICNPFGYPGENSKPAWKIYNL